MQKILLLFITALVLSGCSTTALNSFNQTNLSNVDFSSDFKKGEDCEFYFLFFGPFGTSSVVSAAKSANIRTVEVVEKDFKSYLLFANRCTYVFGK